jgi:hypothetical protein
MPWSFIMLRRIQFAVRSLGLFGFVLFCWWTVVALAGSRDEKPVRAAALKPVVRISTFNDADLLEGERARRTIRAERLNREVLRTMEAVRKQSSSDPDSALGELKRALTTVIASTDIDPDARERLRAKVQANIDQLLVTREKVQQLRLRALERNAVEEARRLATDQLVQRDEQIEQLIDKVRSLMAEGYIGNPDAFERAEEVARASFELAPYSGVTAAAVFDAEAAGQLDKAERLRYLRYDKFLATLQEVCIRRRRCGKR